MMTLLRCLKLSDWKSLFQVWLLEVNSSPTMEYSTTVTEKLCSAVQEDTLKVIVDLPLIVDAKGALLADVDAEDTGAWERILSVPAVAHPLYTGTSLLVKGKCIHHKEKAACIPVPRVYESHMEKQAKLKEAQAVRLGGSTRHVPATCQDVELSCEHSVLNVQNRGVDCGPYAEAAASPAVCQVVSSGRTSDRAQAVSDHGNDALALYSSRCSAPAGSISHHSTARSLLASQSGQPRCSLGSFPDQAQGVWAELPMAAPLSACSKSRNSNTAMSHVQVDNQGDAATSNHASTSECLPEAVANIQRRGLLPSTHGGVMQERSTGMKRDPRGSPSSWAAQRVLLSRHPLKAGKSTTANRGVRTVPLKLLSLNPKTMELVCI